MDYILEFLIGLLTFVFGCVGTLVIVFYKDMSRWLEKLDKKTDEQGEVLVRMDEKMNGYDELKRRVENDHKEMEEMSKELAMESARIARLEEKVQSIIRVCVQEHGNGNAYEIGG